MVRWDSNSSFPMSDKEKMIKAFKQLLHYHVYGEIDLNA